MQRAFGLSAFALARFAAVLALLATLAGCERPDGDVALIETPGGRVYALATMKNADRVAIRIAWRHDWPFDPANNPMAPPIGATLMLTGGAGEKSPADMAASFEDLGAVGELRAELELVEGGLAAPPAQFEDAMTLARDVLQTPRFDRSWFERARDDMAARLDAENAPSARAWDAFLWDVLGDPLARALSSSAAADGLRTVARADLEAWRRATFRDPPAAIAIAGPISEREASRAIDYLLDGAPPAEGASPPMVAPSFEPKTIHLRAPAAFGAMIALIAPIAPREADADAARNDLVDRLIADMLGGDPRSALFAAVRGELRASYDFSAFVDAYGDDARFLTMMGVVGDRHLAATRDAVASVWARLRAGDLGPEFEARAERFLAFERDRLSEPYAAADAMMRALARGGDVAQALTPEPIEAEDVRRRLREAYPEKAGLIVLAASSERDVFEDACSITQPRQALGCAARPPSVDNPP